MCAGGGFGGPYGFINYILYSSVELKLSSDVTARILLESRHVLFQV